MVCGEVGMFECPLDSDSLSGRESVGSQYRPVLQRREMPDWASNLQNVPIYPPTRLPAYTPTRLTHVKHLARKSRARGLPSGQISRIFRLRVIFNSRRYSLTCQLSPNFIFHLSSEIRKQSKPIKLCNPPRLVGCNLVEIIHLRRTRHVENTF